MNLITLDAQGRARVKHLAGENTLYQASVDEKGVITLVPALVITDEQKYLRRRLNEILAERGLVPSMTQEFTWEALAALVPVNDEVPPQGVEADVIEAVEGIRRGRSGVSAKNFLASLNQGENQ